MTISALAVSGFTINASTLSTISFGAIACQNSGSVVNSVNDAEAINIVVRVNGVVVNVGGIVAQNDSSGTVSECGNNMKISVSAYQEARVGGIAGYNNGHITECYSSAQITAVCQNIGSMTYVGGIAGFNDTNARIEMAYVKGQIVAESEANNVYAGGIVGYTKNTNISYTYTAVSEIIIQRNTEGEAIKLGGTFVGYADTLTNSSNPNFYVYAPQFGREEDENLFLTQQIDITSYTAVSDLVGYMNEQLQENIFVYSNSDIHFVWENA